VDTTNLATGDYFVKIQVGSSYSCGLTAKKGLYCWGYQVLGALGNAAWSVKQIRPATVDLSSLGAQFPVDFVASYDWAGLVSNTGKIYTWGTNRTQSAGVSTGNLGSGRLDPYLQATPTEVSNAGFTSGIPEFKKLMNDTSGTQCALTTDNKIYTWGRNDIRQIDTTGVNIGSPVLFDDSMIQ
jgi:hypothetical protein